MIVSWCPKCIRHTPLTAIWKQGTLKGIRQLLGKFLAPTQTDDRPIHACHPLGRFPWWHPCSNWQVVKLKKKAAGCNNYKHMVYTTLPYWQPKDLARKTAHNALGGLSDVSTWVEWGDVLLNWNRRQHRIRHSGAQHRAAKRVCLHLMRRNKLDTCECQSKMKS